MISMILFIFSNNECLPLVPSYEQVIAYPTVTASVRPVSEA